MQETLLIFDGERYRLLAWVVMPNHVHVLVQLDQQHPLPKVLHSWKSYVANQANKILGRSGPFWQREYFDRFIRNEDHYRNAVRYIEDNPVKAGLVMLPEDWRFSSARLRSAAEKSGPIA
jgi:REP element-mobilizing transposase RayT